MTSETDARQAPKGACLAPNTKARAFHHDFRNVLTALCECLGEWVISHPSDTSEAIWVAMDAVFAYLFGANFNYLLTHFEVPGHPRKYDLGVILRSLGIFEARSPPQGCRGGILCDFWGAPGTSFLTLFDGKVTSKKDVDSEATL